MIVLDHYDERRQGDHQQPLSIEFSLFLRCGFKRWVKTSQFVEFFPTVCGDPKYTYSICPGLCHYMIDLHVCMHEISSVTYNLQRFERYNI